LQFDGTEDGIYEALRGRPLLTQKIAAIEHCAANDIGVILVPVLKPGVNDHNVGDIIRFALRYAPAVRGVHFQPISYFGRYPIAPIDADRLTIPDVIRPLWPKARAGADRNRLRRRGARMRSVRFMAILC
jgi:7,8-dihydro-6-hydroxymethylpterin dimethyltransferase